MARAYSDDLRRKFLEAYDAGQVSLRVLAQQFHVGAAWAFKVSADRRRTGSPNRVPRARSGPVSQVDTERIATLLQAHPDMRLPELQQHLIAQTGRSTSVPHLWRVVRKMGFRRKKSRSTQPNATPKPTVSAAKRS